MGRLLRNWKHWATEHRIVMSFLLCDYQKPGVVDGWVRLFRWLCDSGFMLSRGFWYWWQKFIDILVIASALTLKTLSLAVQTISSTTCIVRLSLNYRTANILHCFLNLCLQLFWIVFSWISQLLWWRLTWILAHWWQILMVFKSLSHFAIFFLWR